MDLLFRLNWSDNEGHWHPRGIAKREQRFSPWMAGPPED